MSKLFALPEDLSLENICELLEEISDSIIITDADLVRPGPYILYVNKAFTRMTGYEAVDVIGKSPRILQGPETDMDMLQQLRQCLEKQEPFHGRNINYRRDGTPFWIEWNVKPIRDRKGEVVYYYAIQNDITDLVLSEQKLMTERLRAEKADSMRNNLTAILSQELRTPMVSIVGVADLLKSLELEPDVAQSVQIISEASDNILSILNAVLDYSRLEHNPPQLQLFTFDLPDEVHQVVRLMRDRANDKGLAIEVDIDASCPQFIYGDAVRLRNVLLNLLTNAIRYTEQGRIGIKIWSTPSEEDKVSDIHFSVADTGLTIPVDKMVAIFDVYAQTHDNMPRTKGGSGMGLAIARMLVELLGGNIRCNPDRSTGAEFLFTISCPVADAGKLKREYEEDLVFTRQPNILCAEDNVTNQLVLGMLLDRLGCSVKHVRDGLDLVEHLKDTGERYDAILMDIDMPRMNGIQATRHLRAGGCGDAYTEIPIIAVTAKTYLFDSSSVIAAGMNYYLTKPLKSEEVKVAFRRTLGSIIKVES